MKKAKKLLLNLLLLLASKICAFIGFDIDPVLNKLKDKEINKCDALDVAKEYLDNILEENFYIVSCATRFTPPNNNMVQFISDFTDRIMNIDTLPDVYVPDLRQYVIDDITTEYNNKVTYKITDIVVNGDEATLKFNLTAPDLGYLSTVPLAFHEYFFSAATWEEQFYDAYYDVRGKGAIHTSTIECELTIELNEDELEVTNVECTSRNDI